MGNDRRQGQRHCFISLSNQPRGTAWEYSARNSSNHGGQFILVKFLLLFAKEAKIFKIRGNIASNGSLTAVMILTGRSVSINSLLTWQAWWMCGGRRIPRLWHRSIIRSIDFWFSAWHGRLGNQSPQAHEPRKKNRLFPFGRQKWALVTSSCTLRNLPISSGV